MEYVALILMVAGIAGAVLPVLPGPLLSAIALILLFIYEGGNIGGIAMFAGIVLTVVCLISFFLDLLMPSYVARKRGFSKGASRGALIGLFVGLFVIPGIGLFPGVFIGAFIGEYLQAQDASASVKAAIWSLVGIFVGMVQKLIFTTAALVYAIFVLYL